MEKPEPRNWEHTAGFWIASIGVTLALALRIRAIVTVPRPKKDLGIVLVKAIRKQADL